MTHTRMALVVGAALALAWNAPAAAQEVDRSGWWTPMVLEAMQDAGSYFPGRVRTGGGDDVRRAPERQGRVESRGGREGRGAGERNGNGPPFCRNGEGHPVHGWQWCVDKGWAGNAGWARESWTDVIFGGRSPDRDARIAEPTLGGILGDVVLGRLARLGRDAGLSGRIDGRWMPLGSGGSVLQLRMGGVPLAELADLNRDGRAEVVYLKRVR